MSHKRKVTWSSTSGIVPDVLSEEKLWELLRLWIDRREMGGDYYSLEKCDYQINLFNARLYRLGAI